MAVIAWPEGISIRNLEWSQPPVEQVNRSPWTGRTRIVQIGPAARWSASGLMPPMFPARKVAWAGFVFALRGRINLFRLPATEYDQHGGAQSAAVAASGTAYALPLKTLPPSATLLLAGSLLTVGLTNGDEQLVGLTADLVADSSGNATAQLATPLRAPAAVNTGVITKRPWGLMRSPMGAKWAVEPGAIYSHDFTAEEAF